MRSQYEIITQSFNSTFIHALMIMCPQQHPRLGDRHEAKTWLKDTGYLDLLCLPKVHPPNLKMLRLH